MKFLVDAQLPFKLVEWLRTEGHDALHTLDLPDGNRTSDAAIAEQASRTGRIVITKDADFVRTYVLTGEPSLLLVATGNIANRDLEILLRGNLEAIESAFAQARFVELTRDMLVAHP